MQKNSPLWVKCNKLWSECVRVKAGGVCQFCQKRAGIWAHHVVKRNYTATAFLPENGIWSCHICHNHDDLFLEYKSFQIIEEPEYLRLREIAYKGAQLRKADLEDIADKLKAELEYLKEIERESRI